jgi:hypothetical protein
MFGDVRLNETFLKNAAYMDIRSGDSTTRDFWKDVPLLGETTGA